MAHGMPLMVAGCPQTPATRLSSRNLFGDDALFDDSHVNHLMDRSRCVDFGQPVPLSSEVTIRARALATSGGSATLRGRIASATPLLKSV
jgi:hypothetical protein